MFASASVQAGEEGGTGPLLSAKLHKSWIADVQLLPADGLSLHAAALPTLLTASNDGSVRLWDLSKGCDGMPLELAQADDLHTGSASACQAGVLHQAALASMMVHWFHALKARQAWRGATAPAVSPARQCSFQTSPCHCMY